MDTTIPLADTKQCSYCAETIKAEAIVCRFCNHNLTVNEQAPPQKTSVANQQQKKGINPCHG